MAKRPFDPHQMTFGFDQPHRLSESDLAGLDRRVTGAVAAILKRDERTRHEIAGRMSALGDDEISKAMLDAYASEGRETHNISMARFLILIAATGAYDVLDGLLREIAAAVVVGEQIATVELGNLDALIKRARDRQRQLRQIAPIFGRRDGK